VKERLERQDAHQGTMASNCVGCFKPSFFAVALQLGVDCGKPTTQSAIRDHILDPNERKTWLIVWSR
jgi:hypothetical protein